MAHKNKIIFIGWLLSNALIGLTMMDGIMVASAQGAEVAVEQRVSATKIRAQQSGLKWIADSPLVVRGQILGMIALYDDPATMRPADYLELYDTGDDVVAIVWFDRFGIQRTVVDRAFVDGGDKLEGVLVSVLDGEPI